MTKLTKKQIELFTNVLMNTDANSTDYEAQLDQLLSREDQEVFMRWIGEKVTESKRTHSLRGSPGPQVNVTARIILEQDYWDFTGLREKTPEDIKKFLGYLAGLPTTYEGELSEAQRRYWQSVRSQNLKAKGGQ